MTRNDLSASAARNRQLEPAIPDNPEPLPRPSRMPAEIVESGGKVILRELDWRGRLVRDVLISSGCIGRADGK